MKQKMIVFCDSRIPSFSIHYLATLLDPTLSSLTSVKEYFVTTIVVPFVIQMVQDLGLSLSKLYPADRPEPVTATPTNSTPTDASIPTDAVNPDPEVVEDQPTVLNRPLLRQNLCKQRRRGSEYFL